MKEPRVAGVGSTEFGAYPGRTVRRLAVQVRGIDLDAVDSGLEASPRVERRDTERLIVFEPTDGDIK